MLWIQGLKVLLSVQGRGEMAVISAVTALLLHYNAMDTETGGSDVSTGQRGNGGYSCSNCNTATSQCYG